MFFHSKNDMKKLFNYNFHEEEIFLEWAVGRKMLRYEKHQKQQQHGVHLFMMWYEKQNFQTLFKVTKFELSKFPLPLPFQMKNIISEWSTSCMRSFAFKCTQCWSFSWERDEHKNIFILIIVVYLIFLVPFSYMCKCFFVASKF